MGNTFATKEISYADEGSFAQFAGTPASATFTKRIPVVDVRHNFEQGRMTDRSIQTRQNESRPGYLMPRIGTLEIDVLFCGHGSAPSAGLTETWLQELLSDGLGGGNVTQFGGGFVTGTSTTTSWDYNGASSLAVRGGIVYGGAKNDGRADGRPVVIGNPSAAPAALLTASPGSPTIGDFFYVTQLAYPTESLTTTKRFFIGYTTTDAQFMAFGCQLSGVTLKSTFGDVGILTLRYACAYWVGPITVSVPQVGTLEDCQAAHMAGGHVFYQTVGTTTLNELSPSEIELTLDIGLAEKRGPAGQDHQVVVGYERTRCIPRLRMLVPFSKAFADAYDVDGSSTVKKHILVSLNNRPGRVVGFYLPDVFPIEPKPVIDNYNDLTYMSITFQGSEGPDTTNDLTRSAIRFFMG